MGARPALVTQADVARAIRAVQAAGLPVLSVIVRPDGVHVRTAGRVEETTRDPAHEEVPSNDIREPVDL